MNYTSIIPNSLEIELMLFLRKWYDYMRIELLNIYRGIAILMVFLHHVLAACYGAAHLPFNGSFKDFSSPPQGFSYYLFYPFSFFHAGVAVFFVVSGFCIHLSYLKNKSWQAFFNKRFFRIYPPYLFALLLFIAMLHVRSITQIASHSLLIHNFWEATFFGINSSFWSVAVEAQLYLIYPLLMVIRRKIKWKSTLLIVGVIELTIRLVSGFYDVPSIISFSPFGFWFSWSIGAYLAHRFFNKKPQTFSRYLIALVIVLAVIVHHIEFLRLYFPLVSLATFMILSNQLSKGFQVSDNILTKHMAWIGVVSYSFYLLHQPLLGKWVTFCERFTHEPAFLVLLSLPFWFVIAGLSYGSYKFIELPSMEIGKRMSLSKYYTK